MSWRNQPKQSSMSFLERWARFSFRNKWKVIGAWVVILAGLVVLNMFAGGTFVSEFRVPGSESQKARDLLTAHFPARSGDSSDLVFEAPGGVNLPDAKTKVQGLIDDLVTIKPDIVSIESPYDQPSSISSDGTIARAVVHWDNRAADINGSNFVRYLHGG